MTPSDFSKEMVVRMILLVLVEQPGWQSVRMRRHVHGDCSQVVVMWTPFFLLFVEADHSWRLFFLLIVRCFFGA